MRAMTKIRILAALALAACFAAAGAVAQGVPSDVYAQLGWRLIGPFGGGRVLAVAGVPDAPQTYYFGSANGGVWKTMNAGLVWKPVFDKEPVQSIGAIAVAPSNPDIVYVGTGEADPRSDVMFGDGVYKSTNGGESWTHVGLPESRHIAKIVVDPKNPDIALVAALGPVYSPSKDRGIYRTEDGGKTWQQVLYVNGQTGGIDLAMDPEDSSVLFAAMWTMHRKPWFMSSGGEGGGLFKSTDGGRTWTRVSGHGLPTGVLGKIGVAFAGGSSRGRIVYALVEAKDGGLFRSDNGGADWTRVSSDPRITARAWYFMNVFTDPADADTVYVANSAFFKSANGGKTWQTVAIPGGDNHAFWINPKHPDHMIQGHDQGVVTSVDGGRTWSKHYNQPIAQIYHLAMDDRFPYTIYASDQDCPSGCAFGIASRGRGGITIKDVFNMGGDDGESGYVAVDPGDPNYIFEGGYGGALTRFSLRTQTLKDVAPWSNANGGHPAADVKYRFTWTSPFVFAPWAPHPLYMGSQFLMSSGDGGHSWQVLSGDLTRNDKSKQQSSGGPITQDNASVEYYDVLYAIAPSPVREGQIWLGTDDGLVWLTQDGGKTYRKVTPKGLPEWARIDAIEPSHFDAGTAFVAVDAHKLGDDRPYIYVTHDAGATWALKTRGLSAPDYVYVVRQDPVNANLLFAGTATGIHVSFDGGDSWQPLQLNLPRAQVRDIAIKGADLVVGTHGRSLWALDDIAALRQLDASVLAAPAHLFTPSPAVIVRTVGFSLGGVGDVAAANPPDGVIDYYLRGQPGGPVTLAIHDAAGNLVGTWSSAAVVDGARLSAHAGINRFVWNLRFPAAPPIHDVVAYVEGRGPNGAYVVPGTYKVTLTVDGQSYEQSLTVRNDPRSNATHADLVAQFNLGMRAQNLLWANHALANQVLDLRKQIGALRGTAGGLDKQLAALDAGALAVQGELYQYHGKTGVGLLNYPVRLSERISYLSNQVNLLSATAPSRQFQAEYDEYARAMAGVQRRWQALLAKDLPALNAKLGAAGRQPLRIADGAEERLPPAPVQIE